MPGLSLVVDSTAYLPPELVERLGVTVVSLYYEFSGQGFEREADAQGDFGAFYGNLRSADTLPTTSPPRVEDFAAAYAPLIEDGGEVVSIHISSGMSETCSNAREAAAALDGGDRIEVVDSAGTAGHLGMLTLAAATGVTAGDDRAAVVERVRQARQEVKVWFLLDTLEYLRRGGRIGTAAAWVGSTLQIKPILTLESEITAVERVRTRSRGVERMVELMRQRKALGGDAWFVQHTDSPGDLTSLTEKLGEVFWRPPEFTSEVGPVIGTHTGPGLVGGGCMPSRFLDGVTG